MARIRKGSRKTKATSRLFVIERKTFLGRKNGTRFQMEKSEIEEHRQILPGGLSVFILFAEKKNNGFLNRNYLENNAKADFFRLRVIPPSAQHVILTPTVGTK